MPDTNRFLVAYLTVSTDRQGKSCLGLEAQRAAVSVFVADGEFKIVGEYIEAETGKGSDALDRRLSWRQPFRRRVD